MRSKMAQWDEKWLLWNPPECKMDKKGMQNAFSLISGSPQHIQTPPKQLHENFYEFITKAGNSLAYFQVFDTRGCWDWNPGLLPSQLVLAGVEEKIASLGVGYLGCPVTADGVSVNRENTEETHQMHGNKAVCWNTIPLCPVSHYTSHDVWSYLYMVRVPS